MKDRRYVILRKDLTTGEICGYCENSFSMSFEPKRVKVYGVIKLGEAYANRCYGYLQKSKKSYPKSVQNANSPNQKIWLELRETLYALRNGNLFSEDKGKYEYKLFRLGEKCPIDVDFTELDNMRKHKMQYDKYLYRNQPFTVKFPEKW